MKTHYLLLSDALVAPALTGQKRQTRRLVAWSNSTVDGAVSKYWRENWAELDFSSARLDPGGTIFGPGPYLHVPVDADFGDTSHRVRPRYEVGDRIVFKECWGYGRERIALAGPFAKSEIHYRATEGGAHVAPGFWRSSRFMPTWAARLICRITEVRFQRLQEITEEDARAEGVEIPAGLKILSDFYGPKAGSAQIVAFSSTWDRLNAARAPWSANPPVWAVTFEREKTA